MTKKQDVNLQLSEELAGIDAQLDQALEALSETNQRIDSFLNPDEESTEENQLAKTESPNEGTQASIPSDKETTLGNPEPTPEPVQTIDSDSEETI